MADILPARTILTGQVSTKLWADPFFAGLVLLFARPYVPGHRVKISSGAMGGPFEGVITGSGLMYTTIDSPTA